jgi:pimeloyl-ACP methyl ester carboxylesterase
MSDTALYAPLPAGIRSRMLAGVNGLDMHILEAGHETPGRPLVLLLHGFPELAYSWRKVMGPLAQAGFHVVAPDQRGYGHTTGWDAEYDGDLGSFRILNIVRDTLGLVDALGARQAAVVGHDFGSPVAAWCALLRPDIFRAVALMSAPFGGPPGRAAAGVDPVHAELAALPRRRKHYQWYYATRPANADMLYCRQGVHDFLRAYYHHKSADWAGNRPYRLAGWTAAELAKMPTYYIMDLDEDMAQTVAHEMPTAAEIAACGWLSEAELGVYAAAFSRTGFQGGLQWYRARIARRFNTEMEIFAGRAITVPSCFIGGASDWGVFQRPGDFERMQGTGCANMVSCHLVPGAGHWVQQEQPAAVSAHLLDFFRAAGVAP